MIIPEWLFQYPIENKPERKSNHEPLKQMA